MEYASATAPSAGDIGNGSRIDDSNTPSSPNTNQPHKRTVSGHILAKLPFLNRSNAEEARSSTNSVSSRDKASNHVEAPDSGRNGTLADTMRAHKARPRKGSLRKTAILGTGGKVKLNGRERKNSLKQKTSSEKLVSLPSAPPLSPDEEPTPTPRRFSYFNPSQTSSSESGFNITPSAVPRVEQPDNLQSFAGSGTPVRNRYASTTDDDTDSLTFSRPSASAGPAQTSSYFPPEAATSLQRRRSATKSHPPSYSSPLARPPVVIEDEWDYTETEWWGWVILLVTWVVFVSGMGSCLGIWSWAWDVGETPYAPPELEDDPTLPIVGYYPALIILTAVMAWVWVVVAWVGMKYFRHAKVMGEDGGG